jgi:hypothetical protein
MLLEGKGTYVIRDRKRRAGLDESLFNQPKITTSKSSDHLAKGVKISRGRSLPSLSSKKPLENGLIVPIDVEVKPEVNNCVDMPLEKENIAPKDCAPSQEIKAEAPLDVQEMVEVAPEVQVVEACNGLVNCNGVSEIESAVISHESAIIETKSVNSESILANCAIISTENQNGTLEEEILVNGCAEENSVSEEKLKITNVKQEIADKDDLEEIADLPQEINVKDLQEEIAAALLLEKKSATHLQEENAKNLQHEVAIENVQEILHEDKPVVSKEEAACASEVEILSDAAPLKLQESLHNVSDCEITSVELKPDELETQQVTKEDFANDDAIVIAESSNEKIEEPEPSSRTAQENAEVEPEKQVEEEEEIVAPPLSQILDSGSEESEEESVEPLGPCEMSFKIMRPKVKFIF